FSTVTGARIDTTTLDTEYWVTNLRRPVRFADTVEALLAEGHRVFVEASPHPVLTLGMQESFEEAGCEAVTVPTLRRDDGGTAQLARALAQAHVAGAGVEWERWFRADADTDGDAEPGAVPGTVELPTYAFQRRSYWLRSGVGAGELNAAGLGRTQHPLLPAAVRLADGGLVLTGRIQAGAGDWLTGHQVAGTPLVPAAALVEWALRAADETGCGDVQELTLREPLVPPQSGGGLLLQVSVEAPGPDGARELRLSSRAEQDREGEESWSCHATGLLAPHTAPAGPTPERDDGPWPPTGAQAVELEGFYARAAAAGCTYGPAFQGLRALWRHGPDLLADVLLPEARSAGDGGFGIHPVLLDTALQPAVLDGIGAQEGEGQLWTPFAWSGVSLWASGATAVRVRLTSLAPDTGDGRREFRVEVVDAVGDPVLTAESVVLRPVDAEAVRAAGRRAGGARLRAAVWTPLALTGHEAFADAPGVATTGQWPVLSGHGHTDRDGAVAEALEGGSSVVLADMCTGFSSGLAEAEAAAGLVREWLAEPLAADATLVLLTRGAVDIGVPEGDRATPDAARDGVWGRLRHVQARHPGRFVLLDLDPAPEADGEPVGSAGAPPAAVGAAVARGEPQLAVRGGRVLVPRWTRDGGVPESSTDTDTGTEPEPPGTVLISGGTGAWGGRLAEHLARTGQAAQLLLVSRRGPDAPGAAELVSRIEEWGVPVRVVAADLAEQDRAAEIVAGVAPECPLTGVAHAAGAREGTPAQVWRARATVAAQLHAATEELPSLRWFTLFSEAEAEAEAEAEDEAEAGAEAEAGPESGRGSEPGGVRHAAAERAGAADHAAVRAYCDALVAHRRARGLPGTSVLWSPEHGTEEHGTGETLDAVLRHPASHLLATGAGRQAASVPASPYSLTVGRAQAAPGGPRRRSAAAGAGGGPDDWAGRLAGLGPEERRRTLLGLVRGHAAAVLGHADPAAVSPGAAFKELGFTSLTSVELRDRLAAATGLRLPAAYVFRHPTAEGIADDLLHRLAPDGADGTAAPGRGPVGGRGHGQARDSGNALLNELARLESTLAGAALEDGEFDSVTARLEDLLATWKDSRAAPGGAGGGSAASDEHAAHEAADRLRSASTDQVLDFIDNELGVS
ncbi:polyketide synthase dehydratase domain-containing protein, partial [Streptomyces smyrnaeus]|uniref:polyketide synthase dehydratase domain-containing protein n=1 Tax=Streptomyces smyrnaeus TaxID=1387713 RepID=UPI0033BC331E